MLVHEPRVEELSDLEDVLAESFETMRTALQMKELVVVVVDDRHLQGSGEPAQSALAGGLVGLVRALATEGVKEKWRLAVLATVPGASRAEREIWLQALVRSQFASGLVIRLGTNQLGKVPV